MGNDRATLKSTWRAQYPQEVAVLRGPQAVLCVLRDEKARRFRPKLAFFTTERTEEKRRATEDYRYVGNDRATLKSAWRAQYLEEVAVRRGPQAVLRVLRDEKAQRFRPKLAFFTTERTEKERRATEDYKYVGNDRATLKSAWRAQYPQEVAVLRGPQAVLRVLRDEEARRFRPKLAFLTTERTEEKRRATEDYKYQGPTARPHSV